jgi:ActR/RegA family two-component response regulator
MQNTGGLRPEYKTYEYQKCFVGYSREAEWRDDILSACAEVLPKFDLEPWYAADHFEPTKSLRNKVVELVANTRCGIYDLSSWQDKSGEWHLPRNVLIELGIAIALNRPTLLLRHTSNRVLPLPACLEGLDVIEFTGDHTLKIELENRLPQWFDVPPDRDWLNRFCIFGNRVCSFREEHPRARQWGTQTLRCHITDGFDTYHPGFQKPEREEIRGAFQDVFTRYSDLAFDYLDDLPLAGGYQSLLCSHCQMVRSTPFAVYRILPYTPAEVFIAIGMSIALETLFEYDIPKVLLVRQEQDLPSLLRGYDVVEAVNSSELKRKLKAFIPAVVQKVRETAWKPRPLPFSEEAIRTLDATRGSEEAQADSFLKEHVGAKSQRILVIDDDPWWCKFIGRMAEMHGYDWQSASNFDEMKSALSEADGRGSPFSAATIDMYFGMEHNVEIPLGKTMLKYIKSHYPNIACIVISGVSEVAGDLLTLRDEYGLDSYISKDRLGPDTFNEAIEEALRRVSTDLH